MKKKYRLIKRIAILITLISVAVLLCIGAMYYYHHTHKENTISNFKQTFEQLCEDDGEQRDRSDGKQTGQEGEKIDSWTDSDSSCRPNYHIDREALKRDSLQYNESLRQNQNMLLTGTNLI